MTVQSLPPATTWSNWLDNESFSARVVTPRTEKEVIELVTLARDRSEQVRVVGTGHSSSPLHRTNGFLMSLDAMRGVISVDQQRLRAEVHAGTKIHELGDPLWELGLSLTNQGEIDRQSILGAISTGTHGTGLGLRNISSALQRARIVTGTGQVIEVDESMPDYLAAARVCLGMLGVITVAELSVSPAYEISEWIGFAPFDGVFPHSLALAEAHRNFSIMWFPTRQAAVDFDIVPPDGASDSDLCFIKMYEVGDVEVDAGPIAGYGSLRRRDRAYRVYPDPSWPLFCELEYMLPLDAGLECYPKVREIILSEYPSLHMPVQLRFVAADDIFLSQHYGRPSAVISVTTDPDHPIPGFFERFDELFTQHGGRPHWGKLHFTSVERLRAQVPEDERFCEVRREFDPDGVFLNEYLTPLFA